ncbi:MAG: hypothetical protein WC444_02980 [Candidatus Paceibacterota bacterium]
MASSVSYSNLEPSIVSQITGAAVSPTTQITGSFLATSKFLYTLLFVAIVAAAFYRYALAGIWRMAASEKYVKMSNEEFKRVTVGLLGVFSMFIVIYTFNKDLLNGDVGLAVLKTEGVSGGAVVFGGGGATGATGAVPAGASTSEADVRAQLAGISINHDPCSGAQTTGCTNVAGLNPATITMLQKLRTACPTCSLLITGGTEPHSANSNHGVGKEAVDLSLSSGLLNFIKTNGTAAGSMTGCDIRYAWGGFKFWDESPGCDSLTTTEHFHVSFSGH